VGDVSRELTDALDRADQLFDNLITITAHISAGEGNLGRLVMDSKLYEAMQLTAERLSIAVEEFRGLIAEWREKGMRARL
jgi:hypothetical protein